MKSRDEILAEAERRTLEDCTWFSANLKIVNKFGQLVPLTPNDEQQRMLLLAHAQLVAGYPVRQLILKDRKVGVSTIAEAWGFKNCHSLPNRCGIVAAHRSDSTEALFRMTRLYYDGCPEKKPLDTPKPGLRELRWKSPHRSIFYVQTAGSVSIARGETPLFVHGSEVAWWRNAKETLLSLLNSLPEEGENAAFLETTANGVEEFCLRWNQAVAYRKAHPDDWSGWIPVFFSWLEHSEYSTPFREAG